MDRETDNPMDVVMQNEETIPDPLNDSWPALSKELWIKICKDLQGKGILFSSYELIRNYMDLDKMSRDLQTSIDDRGVMIGNKVNPAINVYKGLAAEMRLIANRFGFDPSSMNSIDLPKIVDMNDPVRRLMRDPWDEI